MCQRRPYSTNTAELNPSVYPVLMLSRIQSFCSCTLLHYCCTPKPVLCWALLCKKKRGASCKSVLSLSCATRWCSSKSMNGGIRAPMEQHLGLTSDPPSPPPPPSHPPSIPLLLLPQSLAESFSTDSFQFETLQQVRRISFDLSDISVWPCTSITDLLL